MSCRALVYSGRSKSISYSFRSQQYLEVAGPVGGQVREDPGPRRERVTPGDQRRGVQPPGAHQLDHAGDVEVVAERAEHGALVEDQLAQVELDAAVADTREHDPSAAPDSGHGLRGEAG